MATNAVPNMLRKENPTRSRRKEVQKDQLRYWRSLYNCAIRENRFYVNLEILGTKHAVKFSKGTWHQIKIRLERVHCEIFSECVRFKSALFACRNSRIDYMRRLCTKKDAPAKQRVGLGEKMCKLKDSDKATFYFLGEVKVMSTPIASKRPEERKFVVDSGASISMHMMSKKELSSEEMSTQKRSPEHQQ